MARPVRPVSQITFLLIDDSLPRDISSRSERAGRKAGTIRSACSARARAPEEPASAAGRKRRLYPHNAKRGEGRIAS